MKKNNSHLNHSPPLDDTNPKKEEVNFSKNIFTSSSVNNDNFDVVEFTPSKGFKFDKQERKIGEKSFVPLLFFDKEEDLVLKEKIKHFASFVKQRRSESVNIDGRFQKSKSTVTKSKNNENDKKTLFIYNRKDISKKKDKTKANTKDLHLYNSKKKL